MKLSNKLLFFIATLCCTKLVEAHHFKPGPGPKCKNCTLPQDNTDFNNTTASQQRTRDLLRAAWFSPAFANPTPLVKKLRNILLEMANSDSAYFLSIPYYHMAWSLSFLSVPDQYFSFCSYAKVINNTVLNDKLRSENVYISTVDVFSKAIRNNCEVYKYATLKMIGCPNNHPPPVPRDCYENGLVYEIEEYWKIVATLMPYPLKKIFFKLYKSKTYIERAHAVTLAWVLNPLFKLAIASSQSLSGGLKGFQYFIKSSKVSKCCCDAWGNDVNDICQAIVSVAQRNVDNIISNVNGTICN